MSKVLIKSWNDNKAWLGLTGGTYRYCLGKYLANLGVCFCVFMCGRGGGEGRQGQPQNATSEVTSTVWLNTTGGRKGQNISWRGHSVSLTSKYPALSPAKITHTKFIYTQLLAFRISGPLLIHYVGHKSRTFLAWWIHCLHVALIPAILALINMFGITGLWIALLEQMSKQQFMK